MSEDAAHSISIDGDEPWEDESLLEELYHEHELSQAKIGELLGCSRSIIGRRMEKYGIDTRSAGKASKMRHAKIPVKPRTKSNGYVVAKSQCNGESDKIYMHRLLAVAEYGFENACNSVVHHKNEIRWDNRPSNIELMESHRDHAIQHGGITETRLHDDPDVLRELYHEKGMFAREIAKLVGCSRGNIEFTMEKYDIPRRTRGFMSNELKDRREKHLTENGVPKDLPER